MPPKTEYARNGEVNIVHQVLGDGPVDLLLAPGFISHLDLWWTDPLTAGCPEGKPEAGEGRRPRRFLT